MQISRRAQFPSGESRNFVIKGEKISIRGFITRLKLRDAFGTQIDLNLSGVKEISLFNRRDRSPQAVQVLLIPFV